jgi:hypothetical protein
MFKGTYVELHLSILIHAFSKALTQPPAHQTERPWFHAQGRQGCRASHLSCDTPAPPSAATAADAVEKNSSASVTVSRPQPRAAYAREC